MRVRLVNADGRPSTTEAFDADTGEKLTHVYRAEYVEHDSLPCLDTRIGWPEIDVVAHDQHGRKIRVVTKHRRIFAELFDADSGRPLPGVGIETLSVDRNEIVLRTKEN